MRKMLLLLVVFITLTSSAHAVTKETKYNLEGQTAFERIVVTGNQQTGNPGYIALQSVNWSNPDVTDVYYLWVDTSGNLRIASYPTISTYTSFPSGDWRLPNFTAGSKVGSQ